MSKIEGGNLLANLRPIGTAQPVSDVAKAKEAEEASYIQAPDKQPVLIREDNAFDQLNKSYDGGEMDQQAAQELNKSYVNVNKDLDGYLKAGVDDATTFKTGDQQAGNVIVGETADQANTTTTVAPELVRTVASLTATFVDDTIYNTQTPEKTDEAKLTSSTPVDASTLREHKKDFRIERDVTLKAETQFQDYQDNPTYTQSVAELTDTLAETESPVFRPEEEFMFSPPDVEPATLEQDSIHRPTGEKSVVAEQAEERFQAETMENLMVKAQQQTDVVSQGQVDVAPQPNQVEAAASVAVAPQTQEPVAEKPAVGTQDVRVEAVEQPSQPQAVQETTVQRPEMPEQATQTREEPLPETRPELQSAVKAADQEALRPQGPEESAFERPELPEYQPPEVEAPVETESAPAPEQEALRYEPEPIQVETPQASETAQTAQSTEAPVAEETESTEDYFPPLPGTDNGSDEIAFEQNPVEDYFPDLPSTSAEPSLTAQGIENSYKEQMVAEAREAATQSSSEGIEFDPTPVESNNVATLSDEELAFLRAGATNHSPDPESIPREEPREIPVHTMETDNWYEDAVNFNVAERHGVTVSSEGSVDLSQFEEVYQPEAASKLEDFDYSLVANRVSEAAVSAGLPQQVMNSFGS